MIRCKRELVKKKLNSSTQHGFLVATNCLQSPKGTVLDQSSISLGDKSLSSTTWHLLDNIIIDDSGLSTSKDPSLQYDVGLRHINADVNHLVVATLEPSPHLLDGDDEAPEERSQELAHGLLGLLVGGLNHHHNSLVNQLVVEVRNF